MKKYILKSLCIVVLINITNSCTQEELEQIIPTTPVLSTPLENEIDVNKTPHFSWEASTDNDGDDNLITYDVYIGTNNNPQILISENQSETTFNAYPNNLNSFNTGETYYWKVVAKDSNGNENYLSPVWSFTITEHPTLTFDGKTYTTIKIGNHRWLQQNLNSDSHPISESVCYENESYNCEAYGRLYSWEAAYSIANQIPGWHLPSDDEWKDLERALGMNEDVLNNTSYRGSNQGTQLQIGNSEFGARLAGEAWGGAFHYLGQIGSFWTSSTSTPNIPAAARIYYYSRTISATDEGISRDANLVSDKISVRLVKDY